MSKEELFKKYQEIVLKTNGGADDYVVALCQISNLIKEFAEEKDQQITDLQKQLAEKEKEIESYKHFKITIGTMENNQVDISSTTYTDQDKISFALEQLEKVKETIECVLDNALKNSSLNQSYYDRLLDEIDNQINVLRNNKDGIH